MQSNPYLPHYTREVKPLLSSTSPVEQAFAKLKALLRKAAARSVDTFWQAIGQALPSFHPQECLNYFANAGYVPPNRNPL